MKILKYPIAINEGPFAIHLPQDAEFLEVKVIDNIPFAYFIVNPMNPIEVVKFNAIYTGRNFDIENLKYLGSLVVLPFVIHYFRDNR